MQTMNRVEEARSTLSTALLKLKHKYKTELEKFT